MKRREESRHNTNKKQTINFYWLLNNFMYNIFYMGEVSARTLRTIHIQILYMNKTIIAICYAGISIASTVKVYMNGENIHIMSYAAGLFLGLAIIVAIMAYNEHYEKKPIAETEEK